MKTFWFGVLYLLIGVFMGGYVTALYTLQSVNTYAFWGAVISVGLSVAGLVILCKGAVIVCEEDKEDEQ